MTDLSGSSTSDLSGSSTSDLSGSSTIDLSGSNISSINTIVELAGVSIIISNLPSTISTIVAPSTISTIVTPSTISTIVAPSTISTIVFVPSTISTIVAPSTISTIVVDLSGSVVAPVITLSTLLSPPPSVISLDDLLNNQMVILAKESTDRNTVLSFTNPTSESLKTSLFQWATAGFQGGYVVSTLSLMPPPVCSDGMSRSLPFYMEYLMGKSIGDWLITLGTMTAGMSFTFSHNGSTQINLHVTRL